MAGSRLERFGTVFSRVRDLLRSGVVKHSEKPIWYDVYTAFPPNRDPLYVKPLHKCQPQKKDTVPEIFYKEDAIRAKFYEVYAPGRPFELSKSSFVSTSQKFVNKYTELQSQGEFKDSVLFEETGKALLAEGIVLRRRGDPLVSAEPRDQVLGLRLSQLLTEQQTASDSKETAQPSEHSDTNKP
ncbi:S ribosomal protein S23%2C mitochondrial [Xyrichtys novacula]|uniref:Small ribosomal subunit protein mS23 n=1 Tax=Xyrichtys novacula TaxID=13765 RepID=A0AAV1FXY7_XYRNO|nr:S ribosomal protein S23%2C mitochondrial [Xyrichtys novacula]